MTSNLAPILCEPAEVYQQKGSEHLTSHQLADFRRCPLLFQKKKLGLVEEEDRPAFLVGRALHTLVLEGQETFDQQYAMGGPVNPRTRQPFGPNTKAFAQWAAEQGKPVLTTAQLELVENMATSVRSHQVAGELLCDGMPEGVVRTEYCNVPYQARIDWFDPRCGIVELKTCDDLDWFESDARRYGYIHQMAFYQALLLQVLAVAMPVHLIAVEKKEPYRCGVWKVHQDVLDACRSENEQAIDRLRHCQSTDTWPTGYEQVRLFDYV